MTAFILIFIVAIFIVAIILNKNTRKTKNVSESSSIKRRELTVSDEKFNEFFKEKRRPEFKQGREFKIAGINYRENLVTFGDFEGYIKPEINNPYDEYAIGIYSNFGGELVGYMPKSKENEKLFKAMLKQDVLLYTSGYISEFVDDKGETKLYGRIYLDIGK